MTADDPANDSAKDFAKNFDCASRLDELESRLAFQDDLIDSLNKVVTRQDRQIADMASQFKDLAARISDQAETAADGTAAEHEIPPHY